MMQRWQNATVSIFCLSLWGLFFTFSCAHSGYARQYDYLQTMGTESSIPDEPYYIIFLVSAKHLDYRSADSFLASLELHPSTKETRLAFGHAWLHLHSPSNDIIGGHSGELGVIQPKYFDGLMNLNETGHVDPDLVRPFFKRYEENPVKYLHEALMDGFFQKESGGYVPNLAVFYPLTESQYESIAAYIDEKNYDYSKFSITKRQCTTLLIEVAKLLNLSLEAKACIQLPAYLYFDHQKIRLYKDKSYQFFEFQTPDQLEKSLVGLLQQDPKAKLVTRAYLKK